MAKQKTFMDKANREMKRVNIKGDSDSWATFQTIAKLQDSDASKIIRKYIDKYIAEGETTKSTDKGKNKVTGTLVRINILAEESKWERFKEVARLNKSDASKVLRRYIDSYISKNKSVLG